MRTADKAAVRALPGVLSPCCRRRLIRRRQSASRPQTRRRDACWSRRSRSASAAPTGRSSTASTGAAARKERLALGHDSIGRVLGAPDGVGREPGDRVVGVVGPLDPVPCSDCVVGEWDMCRNGQHTEHGIKAPRGFARQRDPAPIRRRRRSRCRTATSPPTSTSSTRGRGARRAARRARDAPRPLRRRVEPDAGVMQIF
jgi:hypothetical protein